MSLLRPALSGSSSCSIIPCVLFAWSASVSVCVVVYVCVCVRAHRLHFIRHSSTFGNITPAVSSLKVVNEHRDTVGSHQVVGVSGERLVLPAFWITWGQTDGGLILAAFFFKCKNSHPNLSLKVVNSGFHFKRALPAQVNDIHGLWATLCECLKPVSEAEERERLVKPLWCFYWMSPASCWLQIKPWSLWGLSVIAIINMRICAKRNQRRQSELSRGPSIQDWPQCMSQCVCSLFTDTAIL